MTPDFISARKYVSSALRQELVGPSPQGKELDCTREVKFASWDAAAGPFRQAESGEEILTGDRPLKRYGIGVLYPIGLPAESDPPTSSSEEELLAREPERETSEGPQDPEVIGGIGRVADAAEDDDLPLSTANSLRPSSLGLSFVGEFPEGSMLEAELTGARYVPKEITVERTAAEGGSRTLTWWLREPVRVVARFDGRKLTARRGRVKPEEPVTGLPEGIELEIAAVARPKADHRSLITISAINRSRGSGVTDSHCLFQTQLVCRPDLPGGQPGVLPYEEAARAGEEDELRSLALLYRDSPAFAVGHGCAADWPPSGGSGRAAHVSSASLPVVEVPSITPEIRDPGTDEPIVVPMAPLAGLAGSDDGHGAMTALIEGYTGWIKQQRDRIPALDEEHREIARQHLTLCDEAAERMRDGLALLGDDGDPDAAEAFRLANEAMLLQQQRSGLPPRATTFNRDALRIEVAGPMPDGRTDRGSWRPFQIAFVLAALRSTAHKGDLLRDVVELIFFPTGGGKTEAYLGLTAFSIFYRRLKDPEDTGVDVLMRYTLRLLTAQQFQRASALICAMETLRQKAPDRLGDHAISIGVWLGGSVTPNKRADAVASLRQLRREGETGENRFVLLRCPWCSGQMGPIKAVGKGRQRAGRRSTEPKVAGYEIRGDTVGLACPDQRCPFHDGLPIYVVDEDVYQNRPSLVIGTVDKFAMLAFRPEARSLFGLGASGDRELSPPNLIIQDELHLISGPLGSMVGLYESLIEELCTDHREGRGGKPKIVGSTATIRRFEQQINDLYGRDSASLFPPRGLDAGDSYFARYARDGDGNLMPGRMYAGIHGPGLGSIQTAQVRTFASLIQAAGLLPPDERDPWWTLLVFFNSLRELGTSLSLLQSDIPDYLRVIRKRLGLEESRYPWNVLELTGRLRNDEVPRAIEELEKPVAPDGPTPVDVCLASNIVEVGVDIDRLSLMAVVGQPKTTSQYIQATGRIGRRWWERPGLVATIYGASKPRDRSHFEKFRSYHERLYAQVEPTSVTPFAPPVLDRALHAVLVAYVRQLAQEDAKPMPVPDDLLSSAYELLRARVESVDPQEAERFEQKFAERVKQWRRWQRTDWMADWDSEDYGLLRFAGDYADRVAEQISWAIPTSMRNVDAECRAAITTAYLLGDGSAPPPATAAAANGGPSDDDTNGGAPASVEGKEGQDV